MNKKIKTSIDKSKPPNKNKLFKIDCQKNTTYLVKNG